MLKTRTPQKLRQLVEKFRMNETHYKSGKYLETEVRVEFINPMMRLLGWDIENVAGYSQDYKDVVHEASANESRRMDYVFKVGGQTKFLIEAKNPSVNLEENSKSINQTKEYAYQNQIPIAVLTDFEELAVYLCKPEDSDEKFTFGHAKKHLVFYCKYTEYVRYWNFLHTFLGKKSIMYGIHDQILQRLMDTKKELHKSIYTIGNFNLLYSIAESFGGESYVVEQDQQIESLESRHPQPDLPSHVSVPYKQTVVNNAFYLAPLYH